MVMLDVKWDAGVVLARPGGVRGVGVVAGQLIPVQVGDIEIAVEAVREPGTEPTAGRTGKAAENVLGAFGRAQETIIEVAKSTAEMIDKAGMAVRPDRVEVEFGLKFSVSGGVIMAGVAGEASLKVTLGYDVAARPVTGGSSGAAGTAPGGHALELPGGAA